ncbi:DnaJ-domain-containing protein [Suhomyces tanzawaensis NRRL Y-17324]|uniref:DnaJ-domain-containing protein n=1 Tax=Suhomyces tanzawaensis NRRL Y-17324 TaxID=984487 RepID=A0A1E4SKK0_9ASCO|nr:DnaJ-domain-containing protein [Suhomyces tanzawaensis NRRL Y-17324]ODV80031.1 DnaJ-domain-containing protein [Suhomyces tanzawaensis NRRL Y-17324]
MKLAAVLSVVFGILVAVQAAWSKEDYEIFSLNDKIQQDLGIDTTFYSWLELAQGPRATTKEITKAYRKKSRLLHPDKFAGATRKAKRDAEERFQRLSLVGNILRDHSLRKRYDYFYAKGFPTWKGTGYYYSKYRPGFVFTLFLLYLIFSGFHFVALKINRSQDYKRIAALKEQIKKQAWGGSLIPPMDGSDRKLLSDNGKTFVVKPDGSVYFVDGDSDDALVPLDENDINTAPGFKDSLLYKIPCHLWNLTLGRWAGKIDTNVVFENPKKEPEPEIKKKTKKTAQRGKKIELPNGKVVYSRPGRKN